MDFMFMEVEWESSLTEELLDWAFNQPEEMWIQYYAFKALPLKGPGGEFKFWSDGFLQWLYKRHPFVAGVLKINGNSYYDWHVDADRGVSVNMLLTPENHSHCLFSPEYQAEDEDNARRGPCVELVYKPNTFYLLNTQVHHCVVNLDKPRYMMSVEFAEDKKVMSFGDLAKEIREEWTV